MSNYSALSLTVLLIFKMQLAKGALFLKANFLSYALLFGFATVIVPLKTIHASLQSHISHLSIDVLNFICLRDLCLYFHYQTDHEIQSIFY